MLATLGDLIEDVVVAVDDPVNVATDTAATIVRRRGGSAANVAAVAAGLGWPVRFLGRIGVDPIGAALLSELAGTGVHTGFVQQAGRTGTIIVLTDPTGERTMLTDRGSSVDLDRPDEQWLDGVTIMHVPLYSLAVEPLAATARTLIGWARDRGIDVSIDVSSVAVIDELGADSVHRLLHELRPDVVFANRDEAEALAIESAIAESVTVIKRGADSTMVMIGAECHEIPTQPIEADDTTGAGDAFAAGFLSADWRADPITACAAGHQAAATTVTQRRT